MSVLKYRNPETGAFEKVGLPSIGDITPDAIGAATTEEVADAQSTADEAVSAAATAQATAEAAQTAATNAATAAANAQNTADSKAPMYTYGTEDLTAGTSTLESGKLYFVYE